MKYAVMANTNGTFRIESEWNNNLSGAKMSFWEKCRAYESAPDVERAVVMLQNENLEKVGDYVEIIDHTEPEAE